MSGGESMNIPAVDAARIEANWRSITAELDAPRPSRVERGLRRVGFPARVTRLVVATPALRRAWYLSLAIAVLVGLGAAKEGDRDSLFTMLVLAPAIPVLGVALAYGPAVDPMYEAQLATPMRGVRLVVIRAVTVLVVSVAIVGGLTALSPATRPMAAAWLLPALGLTSAALALMTVFPPRRAAAVAAASWFVAAFVVRAASDDGVAVFGAIGQVAMLAVAVVGIAVLAARHDRFDRAFEELAP